MAAVQQKKRNNTFKLHRNLKRNGYECWRYFFNGRNKYTGDDGNFFIELSVINPGISLKEPIFSFRESLLDSASKIQAVISGTDNEDKTKQIPSYVALRVGMYGARHMQINTYYPSEKLQISKKKLSIRLGNCFFSDTVLQGQSSVTADAATFHREYFSDAGTASWNLKYECQIDFIKGYKTRAFSWIPQGVKTIMAGVITIDGDEYIVSPQTSIGYTDKSYGVTFPAPWFFMSSSNLTSVISGKRLNKSYFALQSTHDGCLCVFTDIEGNKKIFLPKGLFRHYNSKWECTEAPDANGVKKIHWSASIHDKNYIIDIDVFCITEELLVRSYELPSGENNLLKVLSGCTATGEIRFYKRVKRVVELLEQAHISKVRCEYGVLETF